jgi:hypothetical protein
MKSRLNERAGIFSCFSAALIFCSTFVSRQKWNSVPEKNQV